MSEKPPAVRFGAAYYAEYQRTPRLKADFDLMAEAGFTVIRVGESVWSTWEPEDGVLRPGLARAGARRGARARDRRHPRHADLRDPDVAQAPLSRDRGRAARRASRSAGARGRRSTSPTRRTSSTPSGSSARWSRATASTPRSSATRSTTSRACGCSTTTSVFQRFVDWLRHRYGTVETLNEEWGLVYWSHRLSTWADLWRPDGNFQPQYDLAWRRFQTELVTEFIGWQADIVRELADPAQFVTTCISYEQPGIEDVDLSARLDVASGNAYYEMEDSLAHPNDSPMADRPDGLGRPRAVGACTSSPT